MTSNDSKLIMEPERLIDVGAVELCVQAFGSREDPAILLISGLASSMDYWDDDFCRQLAAGSRRVLRYDHRDTGRSTSCPAGRPDYTGRQLVEDVVGLLDALGIRTAHLVGVSAGGGVTQEAALTHPERVGSLTLIATSPAVATHRQLPASIEPVASYFADPPPEPDWADRAAVIDYLVDAQRTFIGAGFFDEAVERRLAARVVDRTRDIAAASGNHWLCEPGDQVRGSLTQIDRPTLVLHGDRDAFFPFGHAEALAAEIPGARLVPLQGMGHQSPPSQVWPIVVPEILRLTG
ncbi:alpha/beta fold hydrolase [Microlunatus soli]|uniref:Pimeloyl-ACP methyl ester carboxylesterase n=1 Tax=Microlunatus soli TaxID=630515 RepID=A0A1H1ZYN2_9ACTN|nr:alpha/beta hydrolase [Microlunatus soli]SDT38532.1 Pimeloyl-ACP methyl ester carboxylesterase [Microlunatus soli]